MSTNTVAHFEMKTYQTDWPMGRGLVQRKKSTRACSKIASRYGIRQAHLDHLIHRPPIQIVIVIYSISILRPFLLVR